MLTTEIVFCVIAVSAYGTENEWQRIRQELADFMDENRALFLPFCADGLYSMVSVSEGVCGGGRRYARNPL